MVQTKPSHDIIDLTSFTQFILPLVDTVHSSVDLSTLHRLSSFCDALDLDLRDKLLKRAIRFQE